MIKKEILDMINEQIKLEYESAFIYKKMSLMLSARGWAGLSLWMHKQYQEEIQHAEEMIEFVLSRGENPELSDIKMPVLSLKSVIDFFQKSYEHECLVSDRINKIVAASIEYQEYATENFFRKFVDEQVEEEATVSGILDRMKIAKDESSFLFLDAELGKRQ